MFSKICYATLLAIVVAAPEKPAQCSDQAALKPCHEIVGTFSAAMSRAQQSEAHKESEKVNVCPGVYKAELCFKNVAIEHPECDTTNPGYGPTQIAKRMNNIYAYFDCQNYLSGTYCNDNGPIKPCLEIIDSFSAALSRSHQSEQHKNKEKDQVCRGAAEAESCFVKIAKSHPECDGSKPGYGPTAIANRMNNIQH
eukprot:Pgem_evm1s5450